MTTDDFVVYADPPMVPVPCATPGCVTHNGRQHMLPVHVGSDYAVVKATCRFCHQEQTRIILAGIVLQSRASVDTTLRLGRRVGSDASD